MVDKVKLELLSDNIIIIIDEIMKNQNLCKLIHYDSKTPLEQPDLVSPHNSLMYERIYPFPFNPDIVKDDRVELRVYYPDGELINGQHIEINRIFFDIVVSKNKDVYSVWIDGKRKIRPYEIMKEIVSMFFKKSYGTLGEIKFKKFRHIYISNKFDILNLDAEIMAL